MTPHPVVHIDAAAVKGAALRLTQCADWHIGDEWRIANPNSPRVQFDALVDGYARGVVPLGMHFLAVGEVDRRGRFSPCHLFTLSVTRTRVTVEVTGLLRVLHEFGSPS